MSFFRVLIALLISGAIAYGLYRVVEQQGAESPVEAVRSAIEEPAGTDADTGTEMAALSGEGAGADDDASGAGDDASDAGAEDGTDEGESAGNDDEADAAEADPAADASTETDEDADSEAADAASASDATDDGTDEGESAGNDDDADAAEAAPTGDTATETDESADADSETADASPGGETTDTTDEGESAEASDGTETAALASEGDSASGGSGWAATVEDATGLAVDGDTASGQTEEADPTDEGESAETEPAALPATQLAGTTSGSVDALKIVTGGMKYKEALATLVESGWQPRTLTDREGEPNAAEAALLEAGYGELEACKEGDRPICRFEFVDGEKRIAAVITAGTGTDPSVIDAFLMDIAAE